MTHGMGRRALKGCGDSDSPDRDGLLEDCSAPS